MDGDNWVREPPQSEHTQSHNDCLTSRANSIAFRSISAAATSSGPSVLVVQLSSCGQQPPPSCTVVVSAQRDMDTRHNRRPLTHTYRLTTREGTLTTHTIARCHTPSHPRHTSVTLNSLIELAATTTRLVHISSAVSRFGSFTHSLPRRHNHTAAPTSCLFSHVRLAARPQLVVPALVLVVLLVHCRLR